MTHQQFENSIRRLIDDRLNSQAGDGNLAGLSDTCLFFIRSSLGMSVTPSVKNKQDTFHVPIVAWWLVGISESLNHVELS